MIKKEHKMTFSTLTMALLLVMAMPSLSLAETSPMEGQVIQGTPFDKKVDQAGAMRSFLPETMTESAESLFLKAKSFRYIADQATRDVWQSPQETESRWAGDCEDKAVWLYTHLKKNGHQGVRLVIGRFRQNLHVWVTMDDGQGGFFILDPTAHKRIWLQTDFPEGYYLPIYSFDGLTRYKHTLPA